MSTIKTAYTNVKNFITSIVSQQEENPIEEGYPSRTSRFVRGFFGDGSRKRPATNVYEPEITDDEDDNPTNFRYSPSSDNFGPDCKRLRVESEVGLGMASRRACQQQSAPRYPTRGSGIPPIVDGVKKQPWEFSFPSIKSSRPQAGSSCMKGGMIKSPDKDDSNVPGPSRANTNSEKTSIEIITLDDDDRPCTSTPKHFYDKRQSTYSTETLPPGRSQLAIMKPRVKPFKAQKPRDNNRFSKYLGDIGRRLVGHSTSIRLKEKSQYQKLLMAYNVLSSNGTYQSSALTKSKVNEQQLQVMYNRFGSSPTTGAVSLRLREKFLPTESKELISSADRYALVPVPRLYSTSTPQDASPSKSGVKAITYKGEPDIVDLENEPSTSCQVEPCLSPITPVLDKRTGFTSPTSGNFASLEDALNNSVLPDESSNLNEIPETSGALGLEESQKDDGDDDISVLAEKIVNKSRSKSINTLALEQTLCPYIDQRWLNESKSSWRENQKHRDERIREETETLKILRRDSTLEKDLEEKIRKKLTLTEIIVLEEPPEELPELTDDMMGVINHARARGNDGEVLAQVRLLKDTISITRGDVRTLGPSQWLNDNVINTYLGLIVLRSKQGRYPTVYTFQTFFYPKLMKEGYSNSLKRWTRKDDIFSHDLIILPIHLGLHWCLACVDLRKKSIRYYDSLGGDNNKCLHLLLDYISREMKERKQVVLDQSEWTLENVKGIPQQQNGSDCGMFSCKFAEYLSRDANFTFNQEDMPYYRNRMIYELVRSDLLHP